MRMAPDLDTPRATAGLVAAASEVMHRIAADLDARFLPVGATLAAVISTVDSVVTGLADVERAFGPTEGGKAIGDLLAGAERLAATPDRQAGRGGSLDDLRTRLKALARLGDELDRVIHVLEIYTINVKIAAAGYSDFVGFADEMRAQLGDGRKEVAALAIEIDRLLRGLVRVNSADRQLASECAKVIPAVPDRLIGAAHSVEEHQQRLAAVAADAGRIAAQIRQMIGAALGSIQIGDSARQRIEHVVLGCRLLDERAPASADGANDAAIAHIARLCIAQLAAIREDFARDAGQLLDTLRKLVPEAYRLLDLARSDVAVADSGSFIGQMEAAVIETVDLTEHMRAADEEAAGTLQSVTDAMETIAAGVMRVQDLGREVGYMSVNANLRCRHLPEINRPVSVIAREIKSNSGLIDDWTNELVTATEALMERSKAVAAIASTEPASVSEALSGALAALRAASAHTASGMGRVNVSAADISGKITDAVSSLEDSIRVVASLESVIADLGLVVHDASPPADPQSPAWAVMESLKAAYTMACEREVHNRHLLPGMEPCAISQRSSAATVSDDDLFDDALF